MKLLHARSIVLNRFLTACLVGVLMTSGPLTYASQATDLLLNKARSLEGRGMIDLAAHSWEQVLLADPNNAEALAGLARFAKLTGRKAEADRYLERLRSIDPKSPALTRIDDVKPLDQQRGLLDEAQRLAQKQDFEGAMRIYRQVFSNEPPHGNWAIAYYETEAATAGGWESATESLRQLVKRFPESADYALALGKLLTYRTKTRIEGMQLLESIKGDPALQNKARAAWRQALVWEAGSASSIPSLRAYLARYSDSELAKLAANTEKAAQPGLSPQQVAAGTHDGQGYQALRAGKLKDAADNFSSALKATPRDSNALSGLGYIKMKESDFAGAIPLFEQALSAQPNNKNTSNALATAKFWERMKEGTDSFNSDKLDDAAAAFKDAQALRPTSKEAVRALAGVYEKQQKHALAASLYSQLTAAAAASGEDWFGLARSLYNSGKPEAALDSLNRVPASLQNSWTNDPSRLTMLAFIHADAGDIAGARTISEKLSKLDVAGANSVAMKLQVAGLDMKLGDPIHAANLFDSVLHTSPANSEAWGGLLNALVQAGKVNRAQLVLTRIPADVYQTCLKNPDFLRSVANLEAGMNRYDRAEIYLERAIEIDSQAGKPVDAPVQFQLADIWSHTGKQAEAEQLLRKMLEKQPDSTAGWLTLISLLHDQKRDTAAMEVIDSLPKEIERKLNADYRFLSVRAGVYSDLGRQQEALRLVRGAVTRLEMSGAPVPADLRLQQAWILLNSDDSDRELYGILSSYSNSRSLTPAQQASLNTLWLTWSQKRAASAADRGDLPGAVQILRSASQLFPNDPKLKGSLAGIYLQGGDAKDAYAIYKSWGLGGATADDFSGAVGAALTARDNDSAKRWLARGLNKYPRDPRLLSLAGKQAAQQGDYDRAKVYLREALATLPPDATLAGESPVTAASQAESAKTKQTLAALLLAAGNNKETEQKPALMADAGLSTERGTGADLLALQDLDSAGGQVPLSYSKQLADIDPALAPSGAAGRGFAPDNDNDRPSLPASDRLEAVNLPPLPKLAGTAALIEPAAKQPTTLKEQITGDLGAIETRNAPYFSNGATFTGRSGRAGVDRLMTEEARIEASTTVGDQVRLSLIAKPTYLDNGRVSATSDVPFGSNVLGGGSTTRTSFGIGAEGQLSTRDLGLRIGMSPNNFLVHNFVGGLRINPGGGPFTFLFNRDNVRDTKLSFAGERDGANVWGGVIANSASVIGNWGDDHSGLYASGGYQVIQGKGVASNNRIDLTLGGYFKLLKTKDGSLTAGLNFSGMHYDKNLRYFTLGQGGYFSPQQYFLANIPIRWDGTWNRVLQYSIAASLGVQHFQENATAYFPLQRSNLLMYPAYASTGGNYNVDVKLGYQLTPQWLAGAFVTAGNARDYRSASAGIFLKYLFQPKPFSADINSQSVPDWKGNQPFALPLN